MKNNNLVFFSVIFFGFLGGVAVSVLYWFWFSDEKNVVIEPVLFELRSVEKAQLKALVDVNINIFSNFDELSKQITVGHELLDELRIKGVDNPKAPTVIVNDIFKYSALFEEQMEFIERFKSSLAIVRNSERFFPEAVSALLLDISRQEESAELKGDIDFLVTKLKEYMSAPDDGRKVRMLSKLDEVSDKLNAFPQMDGSKQDFIGHYKLLVERHPKKNEIFTDIFNNKISQPLDNILINLNSYNRNKNNNNKNIFTIILSSYIFLMILMMSLVGKLSKPDTTKDFLMMKERLSRYARELKRLRALKGDVKVDSGSNFNELKQMSATVEHEINTPLGYLKSNIEMLSMTFDKVKECTELLDSTSNNESVILELKSSDLINDIPEVFSDIFSGVSHIQNVLGSIKSFTSKPVGDRSALDVHNVLDNVVRMTHRSIDKNVEVERDFSAIDPVFYGYPSEIAQLFINLMNNAYDAIEESDEYTGDIKIITKNITPTQISVVISDNGIGMKSEIKERIFQAFYTTKEPGKGTGLGMSVVQNIVNHHKAKIKVSSEEKRGTVIQVVFPKEPKI